MAQHPNFRPRLYSYRNKVLHINENGKPEWIRTTYFVDPYSRKILAYYVILPSATRAHVLTKYHSGLHKSKMNYRRANASDMKPSKGNFRSPLRSGQPLFPALKGHGFMTRIIRFINLARRPRSRPL